MRLDLPNLVRLDHPNALAAIGGGPTLKFGQPRQLRLVGRHDQLAAEAIRDCLLFAVSDQLGRAGDAKPGLERAGLVVDAGVDDAAVVPGLMLPDLCLLLEHDQSRAGPPAQNLARSGQPDDPRPDHHDVAAPVRTALSPLCHLLPLVPPSIVHSRQYPTISPIRRARTRRDICPATW